MYDTETCITGICHRLNVAGIFYVIYMNGESIYKCNINIGKTYDAS